MTSLFLRPISVISITTLQANHCCLACITGKVMLVTPAESPLTRQAENNIRSKLLNLLTKLPAMVKRNQNSEVLLDLYH